MVVTLCFVLCIIFKTQRSFVLSFYTLLIWEASCIAAHLVIFF